MLKPSLYVFQWISDLGGADTRLKDLLLLLKNDFDITCIPNDDFRLKEKHNTDFLDKNGIKYTSFSNLSPRLNGYAYANCNFRIFEEKHRIQFIQESGLKFIWSNDMMWHTPDELEAVALGQINCILFTSLFHKSLMAPSVLDANPSQGIAVLENYFDSDSWIYFDRPQKSSVTCGKISRADTMKYSEDFPIFYESATRNLSVDFKIMGWNDSLQKKYAWFNFSNSWEFLPENGMNTQKWLETIDIYLYNCNHKFIENQSRSLIEAQLTGCPIVAPNQWNFPNMVWNQRTGYLWDTLEDAQDILSILMNHDLRKQKGLLASEFTRDLWCNVKVAKENWFKIIHIVSK